MSRDFFSAVARHMGENCPENNSGEKFCVYWNDGGEVLVTEWPDTRDIGHKFECSDFDAWSRVQDLSQKERAIYSVRLFDRIIAAGCDPVSALEQMNKIPEFKGCLDWFGSMMWKTSARPEDHTRSLH